MNGHTGTRQPILRHDSPDLVLIEIGERYRVRNLNLRLGY